MPNRITQDCFDRQKKSGKFESLVKTENLISYRCCCDIVSAIQPNFQTGHVHIEVYPTEGTPSLIAEVI